METLKRYVNRKVYKEFPGHGWYSGQVLSIRKKAGKHLYLVKYTDGDSEEILASQLEKHLVPLGTPADVLEDEEQLKQLMRSLQAESRVLEPCQLNTLASGKDASVPAAKRRKTCASNKTTVRQQDENPAAQASRDQGSNAGMAPATTTRAAASDARPADDAGSVGAGLGTAAAGGPGSSQPAGKDTAVKTYGGKVSMGHAAAPTPAAGLGEATKKKNSAVKTYGRRISMGQGPTLTAAPAAAAAARAKSVEGSSSPVGSGCSEGEWSSGAADDTSVDTERAGTGAAAAAAGGPLEASSGGRRPKRAAAAVPAAKGAQGVAKRARCKLQAAALTETTDGNSPAVVDGVGATPTTAATAGGSGKSSKKTLGTGQPAVPTRKGKGSVSSNSGTGRGKGSTPAAGAGGEGSGTGKSKKAAPTGAAAGGACSGKGKKGAAAVDATAAEVDWKGLAAAAGVETVAMVGEKPLWEVPSDQLPLVQDGDMQKYLFEQAVSCAAGKEPYRAFEDVKVVEAEELAPEAQAAVKECQREYWKQYRLAILSEEKRVATELKRREEAAAAAAAAAAGDAGDATTSNGDENEVADDEQQQQEEEQEEDETAAADGSGQQKKKNKKIAGDDDRSLSKRPDRVADSIMNGNGTRVNQEHILGHVPGIAVNQKFFLRAEMHAVGLHKAPLHGIVTIKASVMSQWTKKAVRCQVASSIAISGNYQDDHDTEEFVIYTGGGGNDMLGNKKQEADQELKRQNQALLVNIALGIPVRVTRKNEDPHSFHGHVFIYDGLYDVLSFGKGKGKEGFIVYNYLLKRRSNQPASITKPVSFGGVCSAPAGASLETRPNLVCLDLSKGLEKNPVVVVNQLDRELPPGLDPEQDAEWLRTDEDKEPFVKSSAELRYVVGYEYEDGIEPPKVGEEAAAMAAAAGMVVCDEEGEEEVAPHERLKPFNYGVLPYIPQKKHKNQSKKKAKESEGFAISRDVMGLIVECGSWTGCCHEACEQRQASRGLQFRLEVFKTPDRGWGVRSWDSIPAGAVVAVFWGKVLKWETAHQEGMDDTYFFEVGPRPDFGDDGKPLAQPRHIDRQYVIDASTVGGVARFINHSCNPNLYVQPTCLGHLEPNKCAIVLCALRPIPAWEELTYDYGSQYIESKLDGVCLCGASNCGFKPPAAAVATEAAAC